jgi:hypothetical protein
VIFNALAGQQVQNKLEISIKWEGSLSLFRELFPFIRVPGSQAICLKQVGENRGNTI